MGKPDFSQTKAGVFPVLFITLLILPHFSFRFGPKEEKILPHPYWVEAQNRDALQSWSQSSREHEGRNFIFAPLQDTRGRALTETGMVLKAPALSKEEEVFALNALKASLLYNREHQMDLKYEELLLADSQRDSGADFKGSAQQYRVKLESKKFDNPGKLYKFKRNLLKKFSIKEETPEKSVDTAPAEILLSGFSLTGSWRDGFDPGNTREGEFIVEDTTASVSMMLKTGYHPYYEEDKFQTLDLRYGDGKVSLLIFLPHPEESLSSFYEDLNFENWNRWMAGLIEKQGTVRIPRFKVETVSSRCCQVTVFETREKGGKDSFRYDMTEVLGLEERFELNANRPFFFAVRDNETDLILLMGQFTGPESLRDESKTLPA